jgi:hypothetical protein
MADRIPFNHEEQRSIRNWREIEAGDMVWFVPDPDENGTVDPDEIKLVLVPKQIGSLSPGCLPVVKQWSSVEEVSQRNLYISDSKQLMENAMEIALVGVQKESNDQSS